MGNNICDPILISRIGSLLIEKNSCCPVRNESPILHSAMRLSSAVSMLVSRPILSSDYRKGACNYKFVNRQKVDFRQGVVEIEYLREVIDNLSRIFQGKSALFYKTFSGVNSNW